MKKSLFITIAILVIVSILCFAAFADTIDVDKTNSASGIVYAKMSEAAVYSITVDFSNLNFTYTATWDPVSLKYTSQSWKATEEGDDLITVTNNSNVPVFISFSYEKKTNFSNVNAAFVIGEYDDDWAPVSPAEYYEAGTKYEIAKYSSEIDEHSLCSFLEISGTPDVTSDSEVVIGTVTVTAYSSDK